MVSQILRFFFVLMILIGLGHGSASAETRDFGDQLFKLNASDAQDGDNFGISVAIDGGRAVVGAHLEAETGENSGAVYIHDVESGIQLFKLNADDAQSGDQFGISVAISGQTALVGARLEDDAGENAGAVYIFDAYSGEQRFKLTAADGAPGDDFGCSVAIDGKIAVVGARLANYSALDAGAAYVFDASTGQQLRRLQASDAALGDRFGTAVGISGTAAIVGAVWDDDGGMNSGSAYIFDVITGDQLHKLSAADPAETEYFGHSVAISGSDALVGAFWDGEAGSRAGAAYVFDVATGDQRLKLMANDATAGAIFGYSVALHGNLALIGARFDSVAGYASGSAYLFDASNGEQLVKLVPDDAVEFANFGYSAALGEDRAILGAPADGEVGAAYLFDTSNDVTGLSSWSTGLSLSAHPNPARSTSGITFALTEAAFARMAVFDIRGRHVRTLFEGVPSAGSRTVMWDGRTEQGEFVSTGVYLVSLKTGNTGALVRKLILMR